MQIPSEKYGLNKRTLLKEIAPTHLAIVKKVKSRIIRKDAEKILLLADKIKATEPDTKVSLICYDNICSKSIQLLKEANIDIIIEA